MSERYMIVTYYLKPNGKHDEITEFKNHVKMKHTQTAKVILDLKEKKVIKNGLNPEAGFVSPRTRFIHCSTFWVKCHWI